MQISPGLFKSYDVRGVYPAEINDDIAYGIGRCFVPLLGAKRIVVGRDMRPTGEKLYEAFARGATEAGAEVTYVCMVSTDALDFAVGKYGFDGGVLITASHNRAQYNGMKFTRERADAISLETGLSQVRDQLAGNRDLSARLDRQYDFLDRKKRLIVVTGHRRESFGAGFESICRALAASTTTRRPEASTTVSSGPASGTTAITSSVAGLMTSRRIPLTQSTRRPSMSIRT